MKPKKIADVVILILAGLFVVSLFLLAAHMDDVRQQRVDKQHVSR